MKIFTGLRIHRRATAEKTAETLRGQIAVLEACLRRCEAYSTIIGVAVDAVDTDLTTAVRDACANYANVVVVSVEPWGQFVPALNALLVAASQHACSHVLFQSLEVHINADHVRVLKEHHKEDVLVVGKAFSDAHNFNAGERDLTGLTTPWNTLSLWSVQKLGLTGFLSVSDGIVQDASIIRASG
jgi:hypothetical protein